MEYENDRVVQATDPDGGHIAIGRMDTASGTLLTCRTAEGRTNEYVVEQLGDGSQRLQISAPGYATQVLWSGNNNTSTYRGPDGTTLVAVLGPDPRYGMVSGFVRTQIVQTPSGLRSVSVTQRTAAWSNRVDSLSLTNFSRTLSCNGRLSAASTPKVH